MVHIKRPQTYQLWEIWREHLILLILYVIIIIKYFKTIKSLETDGLLQKTFNTSKQISVDSSDCWFSFVTSIFKELKLSSTLSITEMKSDLITRYMKYWEREIRKNAIDKRGKLRTYYTFKPFFKKEPYLSEIKSREERICLTQFRLSSHQLEIERGRYKKVKEAERKCIHCNSNEIEDEIHFRIKCDKYREETGSFHSQIVKLYKNFSDLNDIN